MRAQREKLVEAILDELEDLTYNRIGSHYKDRVGELPNAESKESRIADIITCFQSKDSLVHSIKTASEKISHTTLGAVSFFSAIVDDIVDAFGAHYKIANDQLNSKTFRTVSKSKNESKVLTQAEAPATIGRTDSTLELPPIRIPGRAFTMVLEPGSLGSSPVSARV